MNCELWAVKLNMAMHFGAPLKNALVSISPRVCTVSFNARNYSDHYFIRWFVLVVTSNYAQGASYSGRKSMLMKCVQVAECKQTSGTFRSKEPMQA